ncbi:MAG: hypothetical protein H7178_00160 [Chitinophagaceae bacterium]|nr:hypothetical protein [Chitinophagaceae bacterium]
MILLKWKATAEQVIITPNKFWVTYFFTDASYDVANVLKVAYRNTSVVLFGKTIRSNSGGLGQASRVK